MERRFDPRYPTEMETYVTRLTHPSWSGHGEVSDISKSGVSLKVPFELASGDIVKLEIADSTLFGFVAHAIPEGTGYRAGVEVQRVLMGGSDLSKVLHLALRRVLPGVPGVMTGGLTA